ncbi:MAG: hypothetical protein AAFU63_10900 [Pseudomonadota bacterium]
MLMAALIFNLVVLVPVLVSLASGAAGLDAAFGPDTDARRILASVYAAIGIVSAGLIALHVAQHPWAVPMTVALFAVQITYKLMTLVTVGIGSPVVITNLVVVAVQAAALAALAFDT